MATGRIGTTPVLTVRWSKAPSAGTTSLSGLDDNSVSLVYSVGYEAVYQNGVLLSRGNDYTATNGTTITLTTATVAGDIIEVFANQTIPLTDTYSQTVSDGRFIKNTLTTTTGDIIYASAANTPARLGIGSTDQVLKVSGGIPAWGAAPSPTFVGASVYGSAYQSVAQLTETVLTWNSENYDTDNIHSTSTNTDRLTVPTGKAGKWLVSGMIATGQTSGGYIEIYITINGAAAAFPIASSGGSFLRQSTIVLSKIYDLAAGDYIRAVAYQNNNGGNLNVGGSYTTLQFTYLGA
jgi:hypothetical protein